MQSFCGQCLDKHVVSDMDCIALAEIIDHASCNQCLGTENLQRDFLLISQFGVKVSKVTKKGRLRMFSDWSAHVEKFTHFLIFFYVE